MLCQKKCDNRTGADPHIIINKSAGRIKATVDSLVYRGIPQNVLLFLRNHTRGVDERVFVYEKGEHDVAAKYPDVVKKMEIMMKQSTVPAENKKFRM